MGWLEQLKRASLAGVPFHVDSIDVSFGDNTVLREYPFQDLPTVFRMGDGVEEIKFSAYVIGDDYIEQREALRAVLTGERVLIHPTAGAIRVYVVGKTTIKENPTAEGGMARFDLTFVRAEARRYPVGVANTGSQAKDAAKAASQAAQDQFKIDWNLLKAPGWAVNGAIKNLTSSLDGVWGQLKGVQTGLGDYSNGLIGGYQTMRANLGDLVRVPQQLASEIANLFSLPSDLQAATAAAFQSAFSWGFDLDKKVARNDFESFVIPAPASSGHAGGSGDAGLVIYGAGNPAALQTDTAARQQLTQLTAASDQLFETLATASYVQVVADTDLTAYDEALALRTVINNQCTRLLMEASSMTPSGGLTATSWHDAMRQLHTAALADLQVRSRDLVRLTTYTPQGWESIWSISYKLFGTADYADEIMAMNPHIRHPLLAQPGRPLRIVRHD
ncbi:DNA circularization protein [Polaromonas sp. UC242_47]|uniref:DNA circularization protein n=1 Tax=Polaromonas sp. UC242_47 TaxID=3374626 RepID=UPI0037A04AD6